MFNILGFMVGIGGSGITYALYELANNAFPIAFIGGSLTTLMLLLLKRELK